MSEFFDDDFPPGEQIPRHLDVTLRPVPGPFGEVVRMTVNGLPVGDPLADNSRTETGYRWHDALHLAHPVCLGWSPVLRSLGYCETRSAARYMLVNLCCRRIGSAVHGGGFRRPGRGRSAAARQRNASTCRSTQKLAGLGCLP
jgi:hypothetical protein